jgi:N-acetylmuramoyl-L-alanine amidase
MADAHATRPPSGAPQLSRWFVLGLVLTVVALALPVWPAGNTDCVPTKEGRRACLEGALFLRVPVPKKGGVAAVAKKYTGSADNAQEILDASRLSGKKRPVEVRIPLDLLTPAYVDEVMVALFPDDERTAEGWSHTWGSSPRGKAETWQDVARWFCGSPKRATELAKDNRKAGAHPKPGAVVLVPEGLLADAIAEMEPPAPPGPEAPQQAAAPKPAPAVPVGPPAPVPPVTITMKEIPPGPVPVGPPLPPPQATPATPQTAEAPGPAPAAPAEARPVPNGSPLTYGKDALGEYAVYHLQQGEALYSAVVVRFTGTLGADDVNALAMEVAKRSGIADVTGIPVGYPVKIPLEDLLPQYLPPTSAQYLAWAKNQSELGKVTNTYKSAALDGVVIILDPGHGGLDRGAMAHGVWEDSYVYDIACRVREAIEKRTKARVLMTLLVPTLGYKPVDKAQLAPNDDAVILTHPWFRLTSSAETKVEVNLRWHLGNQYFERLQAEGVDPQRVVFTSIHADSLHPSLRGTMFYIAGTDYRDERWCSSGESYERFKEVRAKGCYEMTEKQMKRAEGLSSQLARDLEASFGDASLTLHPYNPTRDHVVRGKRSWVPAVLRNSIVPCSVLVEVCNLNNVKDAALIADPSFRQAVAEAYVDALIRYYS